MSGKDNHRQVSVVRLVVVGDKELVLVTMLLSLFMSSDVFFTWWTFMFYGSKTASCDLHNLS